jgi:hypothetical protein
MSTAFPVSDAQSASPATVEEMKAMARGMTLRDYFAAKAMAAFIRGSPHGTSFGTTDEGKKNCQDIAFVAYTMADVMLKEREA